MALAAAQRRQILTVLMTSLLLDLISFTFILPLFPSLLSFYRAQDPSPTSLLKSILHYLNAYKNAFARPIDSRYDVVLLGGALGSLFSLLQALAAPVIGRFSDRYGRRRALLASLLGNVWSVALWVAATDFRTFLASRVVGGLSEGNVQLANAIAADISDESQRGATMALVGACFSIAFTCGPALGAALASIKIVEANPFISAAIVSLALITVEFIYIYLCLPETHPRLTPLRAGDEVSWFHWQDRSPLPQETDIKKKTVKEEETKTPERKQLINTPPAHTHTNHPTLLNAVHFLFLVPFSGLEFSLPFLTVMLYTNSTINTTASPAALNGRLLSLMGLIASILQGSVIRRLPPLATVRIGVITCAISFFLLARVSTITGLYAAASLLAVTSATVVTGLNSLGSLEAHESHRGAVLGHLRAWGQAGRATGPVLFCSLFWWAGRDTAYATGGVAMCAVAAAVVLFLKEPSRSKTV